MKTIVIRNGTIVDGTGKPAFAGDVVIDGDKIADVIPVSGTQTPKHPNTQTTLDATGLLVTPGFIDSHTHSDAYLVIEPDAPSKITQGITTEINGQCGGSVAPRYGEARLSSDWASVLGGRICRTRGDGRRASRDDGASRARARRRRLGTHDGTRLSAGQVLDAGGGGRARARRGEEGRILCDAHAVRRRPDPRGDRRGDRACEGDRHQSGDFASQDGGPGELAQDRRGAREDGRRDRRGTSARLRPVSVLRRRHRPRRRAAGLGAGGCGEGGERAAFGFCGAAAHRQRDRCLGPRLERRDDRRNLARGHEGVFGQDGRGDFERFKCSRVQMFKNGRRCRLRNSGEGPVPHGRLLLRNVGGEPGEDLFASVGRARLRRLAARAVGSAWRGLAASARVRNDAGVLPARPRARLLARGDGGADDVRPRAAFRNPRTRRSRKGRVRGPRDLERVRVQGERHLCGSASVLVRRHVRDGERIDSVSRRKIHRRPSRPLPRARVMAGQARVAGSVVAGFPSPAEQYLEPPLDLNALLVKRPAATYFVRVEGDSMTGAGIGDGDLLVVDRSLTPASGDVVIAAVDGEFTVKRFVKEKDGTVELQPANPNYPACRVPRGHGLTVTGKGTAVIHRL